MATIHDVAKIVGVSPSVVSQVMNRKAGAISISADTCARVRRIAGEMGYVADGRARLLRTRQSPMVGVLACYVHGTLRPDLLQAVSQKLNSVDREILIGVHRHDLDTARRQVNAFRAYRTSGVIIIASTVAEAQTMSALTLEGIGQCGPTVCVCPSGPVPKVPTVHIDLEEGFVRAMTLFAERGYRRIVLIAPAAGRVDPLDASVMEWSRRVPGIRFGVIRRAGKDAREIGLALAEDVRGQLADGPVGALATDDRYGCAVASALVEMGVRVPEQVAIIGRGNMPEMADVCRPALTTYNSRDLMSAMGEKTVDVLLAAKPGEGIEPRAYPFRQEMVIRETFPG